MHLRMQSYRSLLATYLSPQRYKVLLLAALLFGVTGLQLVTPQIAQRFIDAVEAGAATPVLLRLALFFLGVALIKYVVKLAETYVSEDVGWTATNTLRTDLTSHCLHLDMAFHHAHTPGELIERVDGDVSQLARFFSQLVIQVLGNLLLLVGILVVLYLEDWRIGLAFTIFGGVALWILTGLRNFATLQLKAERQASAELFGFLEERLDGTEDLRANGATGYTMQRLFGHMRTLWARSQAATKRTAPFGSIIVIWFETGTALALALGAFLFQRDIISLGAVFLLYSYIRMLMTPLMLLTQELQHLQEASASLLRIGELYNTQPAIVDGVGASLPAGALTVEFQQVSFHYGAFHPKSAGNANVKANAENEISAALHEVSFCLAPGRTLGLLGRTGSGKSTIARLLLRLHDPQQGMISLGGVDIRKLTLSDLHNRAGIVTQEVKLFQATLRDNLALFNQQIADARLWAVLDELGLAAWAQALPQGLDTMLAAGDGGLSAGEAQLLACARVFLRQPSVVILDEASSRLDPATEQRIDRAIVRLLHPAESPRTGIVIAHRLATVQRVDDILILDNGRIVEYGPRQVLAENPNTRFARLLSESGFTGFKDAQDSTDDHKSSWKS